jgi:hypothetical protein
VNDDSENGSSRPRWAPIVRPALQDEVVSRIRQMIDDGALLPGSRRRPSPSTTSRWIR